MPGLSLYLLGVGSVAGLANICFLPGTNYASQLLRGVFTDNLLALQPVFGAIVRSAVSGEIPTASALMGCLPNLTAVLAIANPRLRLRRHNARTDEESETLLATPNRPNTKP